MKFIDILKSPIRFIKDRFFKEYPDEYSDIPKNSGKVIEKDGQKIAVYKDENGNIKELSPFCTHLGCVVQWDDKENRWECPCHGASYSKEGKVTSGPARKDLEEIVNEQDGQYIMEILEIKDITHDVKQFKVTKPQGYSYTPGQATEVAINKEVYRDKFRPFTFTSLKDSNYLEFIIKGYPTDKYPDHTGVTEEIHNLKEGDMLIIKDPVGTIEYEGKGVFIAGGAGITPFIAIFRDLESKNILEGNKLIFSNKKEEDIILKDELLKKFGNDVVFTLSREDLEKFESGRIDKELLQKNIKDFNQYFYICGPSGFEDKISEFLVELGADKEKIVVEEW